MDPNKVINALNFVQREGDPDAYVPDIVIQHRKKEEEKRFEQLISQHYAKKMKDRDAIFDFDDDFDNLSEISEKYAAQQDKENRENRQDETPKKIEKNALRENLKREAIRELSCERKKSSKMARESLTKSGLVKIQKSDKIGKNVKIKIKSNNQSRQKLNDNLLQNKMRAPKVPRVDSVN